MHVKFEFPGVFPCYLAPFRVSTWHGYKPFGCFSGKIAGAGIAKYNIPTTATKLNPSTIRYTWVA